MPRRRPKRTSETVPEDNRSKARGSKARVSDLAAEDAAFRLAMEALAEVPDKDRGPAPTRGGAAKPGSVPAGEEKGSGQAETRRAKAGQRKRARQTSTGRQVGGRPGSVAASRFSDADVLDLHGARVEEGIRRLEAFLVHARARQRAEVLVITGRGRRSPDGIPRLKGAVEQHLRGHARVGGFEEAPRSLGGQGALVIRLRPRGRG